MKIQLEEIAETVLNKDKLKIIIKEIINDRKEITKWKDFFVGLESVQ